MQNGSGWHRPTDFTKFQLADEGMNEQEKTCEP